MATTSTTTRRVAVVTGANKGIGYQIALQLTSSGHFSDVILACRDKLRGMEAFREINQTLLKAKTADQQIRDIHKPYCQVSVLPLIIGNMESHVAFRKAIEETYGQIDVLINNAAIAYKTASQVPFKLQCGPTLKVNFHGTVNFTEEVLPLIRKGHDARIVNVASGAGRLNQLTSMSLRESFTSEDLTMTKLRQLVHEFEHDVMEDTHEVNGWSNSNYGISKLAIIAATKVWAREEAVNGIQVNCCCPGYCDTDMTNHKGPRSAEDGAKNAVLPATMVDCGSGLFYENSNVSEW